MVYLEIYTIWKRSVFLRPVVAATQKKICKITKGKIKSLYPTLTYLRLMIIIPFTWTGELNLNESPKPTPPGHFPPPRGENTLGRRASLPSYFVIPPREGVVVGVGATAARGVAGQRVLAGLADAAADRPVVVQELAREEVVVAGGLLRLLRAGRVHVHRVHVLFVQRHPEEVFGVLLIEGDARALDGEAGGAGAPGGVSGGGAGGGGRGVAAAAAAIEARGICGALLELVECDHALGIGGLGPREPREGARHCVVVGADVADGLRGGERGDTRG